MKRRILYDTLIATDRHWTDPRGFSGFDGNVPDKVARNTDGTVMVSYTTYRIYEVQLECGHWGEFMSTGWLGSTELDCKVCDKISSSQTVAPSIPDMELTFPDKPIPPPLRNFCDWCGYIDHDGKHSSWLCRFACWLSARDRKKKGK